MRKSLLHSVTIFASVKGLKEIVVNDIPRGSCIKACNDVETHALHLVLFLLVTNPYLRFASVTIDPMLTRGILRHQMNVLRSVR